MIGDIIFFKKNSSLISKAIAYITKSKYSHVGLIVGYDNCTNIVTIIESDRFVNTRINILELNKEEHSIYTVEYKSKEQIDNIIKLSHNYLGFKYDYFQILGLFLSLIANVKKYNFFNNSNKFICSELIDIVLYKSGIKRKDNNDIGNLTPQELIDKYYMFKRY